MLQEILKGKETMEGPSVYGHESKTVIVDSG
jgi:hypothetical protein